MNTFSLSLMANRIAIQDGRDEDATAFLHRQIRNWFNMGLLSACDYRGHGKTATALFDESALCAARLYSVLIDLGFDVKLLRNARDIMKPDLLKVIESSGEWTFELTLKRERSTGKTQVTGGFREAGKEPDKTAMRILAAQDKEHGLVLQATVLLPASALFHTLLES